MADVRRALAADHPIELLGLTSSLLAALEPTRPVPFAGRIEPEDTPTIADLVNTFVDVELPETSALLTTIGQLCLDEVLRSRIRRELAARPHQLPRWLTELDRVEAYEAAELVHVLADGDNLVVGTRFPGGEELSFLVYVDHNLGSLAKDAFVAPEAFAQMARTMTGASDEDMTWRPVSLPDARTRMADAVHLGRITYPPFETETWPACRPLVEWLIDRLPEGGRGYERPEWTAADLADLTERFFASPPGRPLDDPEHRDLVGSLLWFGTGYGPGDPLRWSPSSVEILLDDWAPRKLTEAESYLARLPDLLRAWIRFAHDERGIRPGLTAETLDAVDRWEPGFTATIRGPRLTGPAALLDRLGLTLDDGQDDEDEAGWWDDKDFEGPWPVDEESLRRLMARDGLAALREEVGGDDALRALGTEPLPDEEMAWDRIPADARPEVEEISVLCDRCCDALLDVEHRTACRRLLQHMAERGPGAFRRGSRVDYAAAAVCWAVGKANDLFVTPGGGMRVKDLMAHFELTQSSISPKAATLLRAADLWVSADGAVRLGSPDYLTAARRRRITERRDHLLSLTGD